MHRLRFGRVNVPEGEKAVRTRQEKSGMAHPNASFANYLTRLAAAKSQLAR